MNKFGRLLTAMVTPFDEKGRVDYDQAKKLALALLTSGSDGLVVSGTTGESPTLTTEEKLRLFCRDKIDRRQGCHDCGRDGQLQHTGEHKFDPRS